MPYHIYTRGGSHRLYLSMQAARKHSLLHVPIKREKACTVINDTLDRGTEVRVHHQGLDACVHYSSVLHKSAQLGIPYKTQ